MHVVQVHQQTQTPKLVMSRRKQTPVKFAKMAAGLRKKIAKKAAPATGGIKKCRRYSCC